MSADPAILLDVSRLISRLGKGPATGIDRVEAEWLAHLGQSAPPCLLLARVRRGQLLLPCEAGRKILDWLSGRVEDLPDPVLIDRLRGRQDLSARAEAALRRMALHAAGPAGRGIAARAAALLGGDAIYLNVGHSNLSAPLLAGLGALRRVVLVHDTIPLDHPEFTRAGQSAKFRERLAAVLGHADQILAISGATRDAILGWRDRMGVPAGADIFVAPIGTRLAVPAPLSAQIAPDRPYFVTLGTIEPRKNHALLLDCWETMARRLPAEAMPGLVIIGRRGWENHVTFARLDRCPANGVVREFSNLDDGAVAGLLDGCHALLMPSRAEGFGLPYTEAAARGIPVLSAPLPVARELLGDYARYLSPDDAGQWADAVIEIAARPVLRHPALAVPQWDAHFAAVEGLMREGLHPRSAAAMPG
ncbi:glycosyltransferase family 1 protein [Paracoccus sp. CPCC 101403]|uniref:Glycosyltransferase family 1 protein n=1 Tax=Paracoccus broussonetiae TaxID=3075834 RepID=A0ABU3ELR7_9RHOB|nr:glycosyltransferase family 1 protein [Paracoccus sp. CPCC 101403]MDT1064385.1 glycosyltransferase family 1 protein [Paracoccus sp. CPCC 101403]